MSFFFLLAPCESYSNLLISQKTINIDVYEHAFENFIILTVLWQLVNLCHSAVNGNLVDFFKLFKANTFKLGNLDIACQFKPDFCVKFNMALLFFQISKPMKGKQTM